MEKIGSGGMGEVYRARDTKLGRDVALKILPETFALDTERLGRFDREAKLLAALNHAHIASIYGTEHEGDRHVLVLEYVGGIDLQQQLSQGPIPVDDALAYALQICEALGAAHDQGVVHRDLKPANVKVTPDGVVKVLDFGLAKALDDGGDDISNSPTMLMSSPTVQGVILGTAAYMSPEQARGKRVDRRADIFAFGCLLFEMLSGRRAFAGETVSDTLASVLKEPPDMDALPTDTPTPLRDLLERCLDKDPRRRLQDIGEARILIEKVIRGEARPTVAPDAATMRAPRSPKARLGWIASLAVVGAAALFAGRSMQPAPPEPPLRKFSIPFETAEGEPRDPIISPDGTRIAYVKGNTLFVRALEDLEPSALTELSSRAGGLFWSPDSKYVGYFSDSKVWKVALATGGATMVCDPMTSFTPVTGGDWGVDGRIVFASGNASTLAVSAQGGDPFEFVGLAEDEADHHQPSLLPANAGVLYVSHHRGGVPDRIILFAGGERSVIVEVPGVRLAKPRYVSGGYVLYHRAGSNGGVWAVPFSLETLQTTGDSFLIASDGDDASASLDGTLVYLRDVQMSDLVLRFVTRDGQYGEPITEAGALCSGLSFSPDGKQVVYSQNSGDDEQLWIADLERRSRTRFSFERGAEIFSSWEPNGNYIYYWRPEPDSIYRRRADGTGAAEVVIAGGQPDISPDNRYIVFIRDQNTSSSVDLYYASLEDLEAHPLIVTPGRQEEPLFSPDGKYVLYESDQSGVDDAFISRFPSGEGKWQVSSGGVAACAWERGSDTVYYSKGNGDIYGVTVETEPVVRLGRPELLYDSTKLRLPRTNWRYFAQAPDDKNRLLLATPATTDVRVVSDKLTVVEQWYREFETQ